MIELFVKGQTLIQVTHTYADNKLDVISCSLGFLGRWAVLLGGNSNKNAGVDNQIMLFDGGGETFTFQLQAGTAAAESARVKCLWLMCREFLLGKCGGLYVLLAQTAQSQRSCTVHAAQTQHDSHCTQIRATTPATHPNSCCTVCISVFYILL